MIKSIVLAFTAFLIPGGLTHVAGSYDGHVDDAEIQTTFIEESGVLTGWYKYGDPPQYGMLENLALTDHELAGTWVEGSGSGYVLFHLDEEFATFTGEWGSERGTPAGSWSGSRLHP